MRYLDRLRYKGKPLKGANEIADKVPEVCFCRFVAVGIPMDASGCDVHLHGNFPFSCDYKGCPCYDYRPKDIKKSPGHWPLCVCGHIAQDHN